MDVMEVALVLVMEVALVLVMVAKMHVEEMFINGI